jgi:AraC-like DNA-binding protein
VKNPSKNASPPQNRARELRSDLAHKIASFVGSAEKLITDIPTLTAMSPVQYQKQLRLHAARERMLIDSVDAASAAFEVGYESATQFNREYSRFFGQPPKRDIRTLRSPGAVPLESVSNQ